MIHYYPFEDGVCYLPIDGQREPGPPGHPEGGKFNVTRTFYKKTKLFENLEGNLF